MSTPISTQPATPATITSTPRAVPGLTLIAGGSVVLNLIAYALGRLAGADLQVVRPDGASFAVNVPAILAMTLIPLVIGSIFVLLARRFWGPGVRVLRWLGLALRLLTLPMPLFSNATPATAATLASMHVIVGVVWFALLGRLRRAA
ncbi:DUF6069 family protein [Ammonicoccus fulvus]|uniref:DUF6069 family protein n=1 Tax=Ammonicoccus fulvus TaxID=3138240 RepID=A0ABZ3FLU5_9ACTN